MSSSGAPQGWYGQQAPAAAYPQGPYGQGPPPSPVVMYGPPPLAPAAFSIAQFGQKRLVALVGGLIAVIGLLAPWLSVFIMSINAFGMVSLAGLLAGAPGGAYGLVIGAILSIAGVLVGAPLPLVRNTPRMMVVSAACAVAGIAGVIVFLVSVMALGGGTGMAVVGFGVWMTLVGSIVQIVGCLANSRELHARAFFLGARPAPFGPPTVSSVGWQGAHPYGSADGFPCPQCGAPLADQAPRCPSCGLALQW